MNPMQYRLWLSSQVMSDQHQFQHVMESYAVVDNLHIP